MTQPRTVLSCLAGLGLALMLVGFISDTVLRHLVQILPVIAAAGLLTFRPVWGAYAAFPVFVFWLLIVVLIWLFLIGVSRIANGTYTVPEIILTFVMAGFSVVGAARSIRVGRPLSYLGRLLAVAVFALAQIGAMWLSFLRPIANR